jgi:hypothetical protein
MNYVLNQYGRKIKIDWIAIVNLMDPDIAEKLHNELAPCSNQKFFNAYCKKHLEEFEVEFEFDRLNPQV